MIGTTLIMVNDLGDAYVIFLLPLFWHSFDSGGRTSKWVLSYCGAGRRM